ncbi:Alpha/beta hydrolase OS=Streptomyces cyaneofuscatus OX=66883 GN=G3I52_20160 PE=4 SV=1 [Streptomyces cyaneofuscatus]
MVLDAFPGTEALFGWSYGGLIALLAAGERPLPHVIAYEPVIRPFGLDVLPDLRAAEEAGDLDAVVGIVHRRIAGLDAAVVEALRADREGWEALRRLAGPACAELAALNGDAVPEALAGRADRVDLIVGELNRGRARTDGLRGGRPAGGARRGPRTPWSGACGPSPGAGELAGSLDGLAAVRADLPAAVRRAPDNLPAA